MCGIYPILEATSIGDMERCCKTAKSIFVALIQKVNWIPRSSAWIRFHGAMSDLLTCKCWVLSWQFFPNLKRTTQTPLFPLLAPLVWFTGNYGFHTWVLTPPFPGIHLHKLLVFTPLSFIHALFSLAIFQKKTMGTTRIWLLLLGEGI